MTIERRGVVTFKGNPVTLIGPEITVGSQGPDFTVLATDLTPKTLHDFKGKVRLITSVLSLDTGICDAECKRFNELTSGLGDNVVLLTISMDLPFTQARWAEAADADRVVTLSDHRDASFAQAYGVLVKEMRVLSRAIFVVDPNDTVRYVEYVKEIASHPDYEAALNAVKEIVK